MYARCVRRSKDFSFSRSRVWGVCREVMARGILTTNCMTERKKKKSEGDKN